MSEASGASRAVGIDPFRADRRTARAGRSPAVVFSALATAVLTAGAVALWSPDDVWLLGIGFHPGWIAVAALAARYGIRGLFLGLAFTAAALTVTAELLDGDRYGVLVRAGMPAEVMALAATMLVAWIAMVHDSRMSRMALRLEDADHRLVESDEVTAAMREAVSTLRARADRIDLSLTVWRDFAVRIERGDPAEAARAVLELCTLRIGAAAGIVQRWDGSALRTLAWHGEWSPAESRPRDIFTDRTASAAVNRGRPALITQIENARADDSDVAAPILDEEGKVIGIIALRGLLAGRLRAADVRDLVIAAQWLAPALARAEAPRVRSLVEAVVQ